MSEDTRTSLLEAAERILIEEGVRALTVRRVGAVSGLNATLITYHFGTVSGLLAELYRLNLEPMLREWEALDADKVRGLTLREVLEAWLGPLTRPSAFTPHGRSIVVFDEIASHGDAVLRDELLATMIDISNRVRAAIRPLVPHLDPFELRARVRFISAATLGPPPRIMMPVATSKTGEPIDGLFYLVAFAIGALEADRARKGRARRPRGKVGRA